MKDCIHLNLFKPALLFYLTILSLQVLHIHDTDAMLNLRLRPRGLI